MREASIDFVEIYGDDYQVGILNLIKYFAKHLGCRIASENWELPAGLVPSLAAESLAPFEISLSRNSEVGGYPVRGLGTLHNFPALAHHTPSTGEVRAPYLSGMIVGYLDVVYRYDWPSRYSWEGDPLVPSDRVVRLGEYIPGSPHPTDGQIPGAEASRRFNFGGRKFSIHLLTRDHMRHIMSLELPSNDMTIEQNL